eukprot:gnl/TRDRNA2_/TRDRNA2_182507_c0_seq1.p1 gnl/TRDRNA2_/TRDRNA2_182507_c0~~gnl/TRDRNA2_/TRDRNA2_182507_c0_seq1.p1  ORF type:complete len:385 (+),score=61.22 gnl/TRDRNA2_/TRDRNA2_182507_c0_seq1:95-1156(+)
MCLAAFGGWRSLSRDGNETLPFATQHSEPGADIGPFAAMNMVTQFVATRSASASQSTSVAPVATEPLGAQEGIGVRNAHTDVADVDSTVEALPGFLVVFREYTCLCVCACIVLDLVMLVLARKLWCRLCASRSKQSGEAASRQNLIEQEKSMALPLRTPASAAPITLAVQMSVPHPPLPGDEDSDPDRGMETEEDIYLASACEARKQRRGDLSATNGGGCLLRGPQNTDGDEIPANSQEGTCHQSPVGEDHTIAEQKLSCEESTAEMSMSLPEEELLEHLLVGGVAALGESSLADELSAAMTDGEKVSPPDNISEAPLKMSACVPVLPSFAEIPSPSRARQVPSQKQSRVQSE